jgi:squalene synthase HpnC
MTPPTCILAAMSVDHYENFPVASVLLPRRLRAAVRDVYRFARNADDIADEGDASPDERLVQLAGYHDALRHMALGEPLPANDPRRRIFDPLAATVRHHGLPLTLFHDLLSAFEQDVSTTRYETDALLLDYCSRSANPVGRIMLHLYGQAGGDNLAWSDAICTGLQLTNFWQDVAVDWHKGRVYIPRQALRRHGVSEDYIAARAATEAAFRPAAPNPEGAAKANNHPAIGRGDAAGHAPGMHDDAAWENLMREQVGQARELLQSGLPLARRLRGRIGLELKLVVLGGLRILERLDQLHYDIFQQRPVLQKRDWALLFWRALS